MRLSAGSVRLFSMCANPAAVSLSPLTALGRNMMKRELNRIYMAAGTDEALLRSHDVISATITGLKYASVTLEKALCVIDCDHKHCAYEIHVDGTVAGFVWVKQDTEEKAATLKYIYIDPEYRREKLATAAFAKIIEQIETLGCTTIKTTLHIIGNDAKDFLERQGFVVKSEEHDGADVHMERSVKPSVEIDSSRDLRV